MLRSLLDAVGKPFGKGQKLERLWPLYDAPDTFLYTPGKVAGGRTHVRDAVDFKRVMFMVVIALLPVVAMAIYNTGYQANAALARAGAEAAGWRADTVRALGVGFDPGSLVACVVHGLMWYLPVLIVTFAIGGNIEGLFAVVRGHEINEGFLVSGMLFPLILPPTIPLWQVAIGIAFGVLIGKEVFGGTGMNILNPALTARAFLFFAYPAQITGDQVWLAVSGAQVVDGLSQATILSASAAGGMEAVAPLASQLGLVGAGATQAAQLSSLWWASFMGFIPGSMGETSVLACLLGAGLLVATGIASVRIMAGVTLGTVAMALILNGIGSETNPAFAMPFYWHFVVGGWAFGMVFMATEPVTAPFAPAAKLWYGVAIGVLIVLIRVVNPAYPEGTMLAILLMNCFAATFDHVAMSANIKRRKARTAPVAAPEA